MENIELYMKALGYNLQMPPNMVGTLGFGKEMTGEELKKEYEGYLINKTVGDDESTPKKIPGFALGTPGRGYSFYYDGSIDFVDFILKLEAGFDAEQAATPMNK